MPLPDLPVAVQVNWAGTTAWSPWEQANANILSEVSGAPTLLDLTLRRGIYYPLIGADTAIIRSRDPGWHVVLEKSDSALAPSKMLGCGVRILRQNGLGTGAWIPRFFGYITRVEPDPRDVPRSRSEVTVTAESPLRWWSGKNVTPDALPAGAPVYQTDVTSALENLLRAAGLWAPDLLSLAPTPAPVPLPGDWGGQPVQFGQALVDLVFLTKVAVMAIPMYATAAGEADWVFRWWDPVTAEPTFHLQQLAGDLDRQPSIQWADEMP